MANQLLPSSAAPSANDPSTATASFVSSPLYNPGDAILSSYGSGVLISRPSNVAPDNFYVVRLWRIPGRSFASSAVAYLSASAIQKRLPAAPGMIVQLKNQSNSTTNGPATAQVLIHNYLENRKSFLVASITDPDSTEKSDTNGHEANDNNPSVWTPTSRRRSSAFFAKQQQQQLTPANTPTLYEVPEDDVTASSSARFYPVLDALLLRAEEASRAATHMLNQESSRQLVDQTGRALHQKLHQWSDQASDQINTELFEPENLKSRIQQALPQAESSIRSVLTLVKDQELTTLLETCQQRLLLLVDTDLPEATKAALEQTGIRISNDSLGATLDASSSKSPTFLQESVKASQQIALQALNQLLNEVKVEPAELDSWRNEVTAQFAVTFDSLASAAQSDRSLSSAFASIAEKTSEWQQLTGRLMQTRSAHLFLEGSSRLQARAAAIFQDAQLHWAGELGSMLTKSFTEGDVALAKLKSIELGDAVKSRLVEAIEIRSASLGGLDGMIAGALASVEQQSITLSRNSMGDWLNQIRALSPSAASDAHESLLAVLSSRSQYRDVALLHIEAALMALESQLGDALTPEELAAIAQGEGGTAKIFDPIAQRAIRQIEAQLDIAESKVTDVTVMEVLKRVRKIMSGELTVSSVMDEIVDVLNDDKVVAAGETLVQQSEHVLDVIESASGHRAVADAIKIAERAGVTKDVVLKEFEKLDVNEILDAAGGAVTDERTRRKLLSQATDTALDFLLRILPSMPVPPFEGVNEGLVYCISNLSMEGFKVRKEDIHIELAGMRATRRASSFSAPLIKTSSSGSGVSEGVDSFDVESSHGTVKATELLIIEIRNISAILENAKWGFEQTYMPYLKGDGMANVSLSGGAIRLQFELRKRRKDDSVSKHVLWEPVLCLHDRNCSISDVELTLQGHGKLNWILNKLASIFKGPLREYVVRTIVNVLTSRSGWILERLNAVLGPYWDMILRTAQLNMVSTRLKPNNIYFSQQLTELCTRQATLVEADESVVVNETNLTDRNLVELVWRERLPLGMNLLMNDESGLLKVVDFPRGSQARLVCEKRGLLPEDFKGATIVGVNGTEYDDQEDLFESLKDPSRPKTVRFELAATEDAERIRQFVEGVSKSPGRRETANSPDRMFKLREIRFDEPGEIGIEFVNALDGIGLAVRGFLPGPGGTVLSAQKSGNVRLGDLLIRINGELAIRTDGTGRSRAINLLQSVGKARPLTLTFAEPYLFCEVIDRGNLQRSLRVEDSDGGPQELVLEDVVLLPDSVSTKRVVLQSFENISGSAESSGILIGDHLVFVNGMPVGAGCRWLGVAPPPTLAEVHRMMSHEKAYPMGLTFARPRQMDSNRWAGSRSGRLLSDDEADTMCVTVEHPSQLGCVLEATKVHDIVVGDFVAVPGIFQRALSKYTADSASPLAIDSVNGQFVPTYATKDMVRNAIQRSWKADSRLELWLCDDVNKHWIHAVAEQEEAVSSKKSA